MKAQARDALDRIAERMTGGAAVEPPPDANAPNPPGTDIPQEADALEPGSRVIVGALGLEGVVIEVHGKQAEIDVRGKRLRTALRDLRVIAGVPAAPTVKIHVDLQPREGVLSELNVIGATVDEALGRLEKFLDQSMVGDLRELRIVHGHGTGQLRRAVATFLKAHPLVERFETAPDNQGGGGATVVVLKD